MPRLLIGLGVVLVILTVYSLVDCALFDRNRIRGLPRWVWVFVILLVPVVGSLLWLFVGRGRRSRSASSSGRTFAPDDDPDFLKGLDRRTSQEERIRQLEQELADLDKPDTEKPRGGASGPAGTPGAPPTKKNEPGEGELHGRRDA
jgi:hypothetical protein